MMWVLQMVMVASVQIACGERNENGKGAVNMGTSTEGLVHRLLDELAQLRRQNAELIMSAEVQRNEIKRLQASKRYRLAKNPNLLALPCSGKRTANYLTGTGEERQAIAESKQCTECQNLADYEGQAQSASRNGGEVTINNADVYSCSGIQEQADQELQGGCDAGPAVWASCLCFCQNDPEEGELTIRR